MSSSSLSSSSLFVNVIPENKISICKQTEESACLLVIYQDSRKRKLDKRFHIRLVPIASELWERKRVQRQRIKCRALFYSGIMFSEPKNCRCSSVYSKRTEYRQIFWGDRSRTLCVSNDNRSLGTGRRNLQLLLKTSALARD